MQPDAYAPGSVYHERRRWTHPHSVRCLQTAVDLLGTPASLLDVGCAEGVHVEWANAHGIAAMGIDLAAPTDHSAFVCADLRQPVSLGRQFDWVLCWEVAEHLPADAAPILIDTLVRHMQPTGRILFTAARPGQPGPGHIHCADPEVWHQWFREHGVSHAIELSKTLQKRWLQCSPRTPWYGMNAAVYWRAS